MRTNRLRTGLSVLLPALFTMLLVPASADAQGRYAGQLSRTDVDGIVRRVEESGDDFRSNFREALNRSNLSDSQKRTYRNQVDSFERATDRLRSRFDSDNNWWNSRTQVQNLISDSRPLNVTMNTVPFRRQIERQWNRLRDDVNRLADTYDLAGLAGGGWTGGGGGGGGGGGQTISPPNWAQGTFYGTASNGSQITLSIASNGSVNAVIAGRVTYGTFTRGNILNIYGATSRVTRQGNGIVTTATDNSERIVYTRSGSDGGSGGGWNPGEQIRPPNWARGTFYGVAPDGANITLTIETNGDVTANIGGRTLYGSFTRGNILSIDGAFARVTALPRGIRTVRTDGGLTIDYRR